MTSQLGHLNSRRLYSDCGIEFLHRTDLYSAENTKRLELYYLLNLFKEKIQWYCLAESVSVRQNFQGLAEINGLNEPKTGSTSKGPLHRKISDRIRNSMQSYENLALTSQTSKSPLEIQSRSCSTYSVFVSDLIRYASYLKAQNAWNYATVQKCGYLMHMHINFIA